MNWFKKRKLLTSKQENKQIKTSKKLRNTDKTYYEMQYAYGKTVNETVSEKGQIIDAIKSFIPFRKYNEEVLYQIDLARWLHSKFPNIKIEESTGSTRPDLVINELAIEIKGPTYDIDLQSIADKCMRYPQYYAKGLIIVLFDINVSENRYNDWFKGMENTFPDIIVIKKI